MSNIVPIFIAKIRNFLAVLADLTLNKKKYLLTQITSLFSDKENASTFVSRFMFDFLSYIVVIFVIKGLL